jgi:hypothetical protein
LSGRAILARRRLFADLSEARVFARAEEWPFFSAISGFADFFPTAQQADFELFWVWRGSGMSNFSGKPGFLGCDFFPRKTDRVRALFHFGSASSGDIGKVHANGVGQLLNKFRKFHVLIGVAVPLS